MIVCSFFLLLSEGLVLVGVWVSERQIGCIVICADVCVCDRGNSCLWLCVYDLCLSVIVPTVVWFCLCDNILTMCLCICVFGYALTICVHASVCMCMCLCACVCVHVHASVCMRMRLCTFVCVHSSVCMCMRL